MLTLRDVVNRREPDFDNLLAVLQKKQPKRPTLFEFFLNDRIYEEVAGKPLPADPEEGLKWIIETYYRLGYDYVTLQASSYYFETKPHASLASRSMNEGCIITDWESYQAYRWKSPAGAYDGRLERLEPLLPSGMKFIVFGPGGVLENVVELVGYDNLCLLLYDDPPLVEAIFEQVGSRLLEYYETIIGKDCVGAIISNDDWGFNTQTMLSPQDLRRYVFPWHRRIVQAAHAYGKPVILHSCGNLQAVYEDIIQAMHYDGKHSYEDGIQPVEEAYDLLQGRIAVIGGIDLDFICRQNPEAVAARSRAMLEKTGGVGYALGTGNSIPAYVPRENYYAMISAALL